MDITTLYEIKLCIVTTLSIFVYCHYNSKLMSSVIRKSIILTGLTMLRVKGLICLDLLNGKKH